jgi:hypothetical protein
MADPTVRAVGIIGLVAVMLVGACGSGAPSATSVSQRKANEMLEAVVVPPGSDHVRYLPGAALDQPSQYPACSPLVDESRLWQVAGDPQSVVSYLRTHPPAGIPYDISEQEGVLSSPMFTLAGQPNGPGWNSPDDAYELVLTIAAVGSDRTGIRADGEVVPPGAACTSS